MLIGKDRLGLSHFSSSNRCIDYTPLYSLAGVITKLPSYVKLNLLKKALATFSALNNLFF
jgi:hypothetical protein